jgi:hypothetical protein
MAGNLSPPRAIFRSNLGWSVIAMDFAIATRQQLFGTIAGLGLSPVASSTLATDAPAPFGLPSRTATANLLVNGGRLTLAIDPATRLRERTAPTGTKKGCDMDSCSACPNVVATAREAGSQGSQD